jgi:hypothetical protein
VNDLGEGIKSARVHVARLDAEDRGTGDARHRSGAHATLRVDRYALYARAAQPQHTQRLEQRGVRLGADDHGDRWGAEQAIGLHRPAGIGQYPMARSGQRGEVGHGCAGNEAAGRIARQVEQFEQPAQCHAFQFGSAGCRGVQPGVLLPRGGKPRSGDRDRQRAADHEAEEARTGHGHGGGRDDLIEAGQYAGRSARGGG